MTVNKDEIRKLEIAAMSRKELNAHAFLCEKEQEEYAVEIAAKDKEIESLRAELYKHRNAAELALTGQRAAERERDDWSEAYERSYRLGVNQSVKIGEHLRTIEELRQQNAAYRECLDQVMRVTADGSLPDVWNGSTGGAGHAEIRRDTQDCSYHP